jgi:hypothetical protein
MSENWTEYFQKNEYSRNYLTQFRNYELQAPPPPWRQVTSAAVGGLTEIGYAKESDYLLVVSRDGRGVFDCISGERVARNRRGTLIEDNPTWYNPFELTAIGIGPIQGQKINLSGLHGGGLPTCTKDGWLLELVAPDWPYTKVILVQPWKSIYNGNSQNGTMIFGEVRIRAFGFSPTGQSFSIAASSGVHIFSRQV